jgi:hypothetical protein
MIELFAFRCLHFELNFANGLIPALWIQKTVPGLVSCVESSKQVGIPESHVFEGVLWAVGRVSAVYQGNKKRGECPSNTSGLML